MGKRRVQSQNGPQGGHRSPRVKVRQLSSHVSVSHSCSFPEMGLHSVTESRMRTVRSCWLTTPTEAVRLTLQVKSTRQKICLRRLTGSGDDGARYPFTLVSNCNFTSRPCHSVAQFRDPLMYHTVLSPAITLEYYSPLSLELS